MYLVKNLIAPLESKDFKTHLPPLIHAGATNYVIARPNCGGETFYMRQLATKLAVAIFYYYLWRQSGHLSF